jgi:hypothetical protein
MHQYNSEAKLDSYRLLMNSLQKQEIFYFLNAKYSLICVIYLNLFNCGIFYQNLAIGAMGTICT